MEDNRIIQLVFQFTGKYITDKEARQLAEISFEAGKEIVVGFIAPKLTTISGLVGNIRGDWTDPRHDCREIWSILAEIETSLRKGEVKWLITG